MPHAPLTEWKIDTNRHVIRASDEVRACLMGMKDLNGISILCSAERARNFRDAIIKDDSPYALIYIGPKKIVKMNDRGVIIEISAEFLVSLVYTVPETEDYLAWGDGLQDLALNALQPQTLDNPSGHVWQYPAGWRYSSDTDFAVNIVRGVRQLDGRKTNLALPLYTVPLQFKIRVFPNTPLS